MIADDSSYVTIISETNIKQKERRKSINKGMLEFNVGHGKYWIL